MRSVSAEKTASAYAACFPLNSPLDSVLGDGVSTKFPGRLQLAKAVGPSTNIRVTLPEDRLSAVDSRLGLPGGTHSISYNCLLCPVT